MRKLKVFISVLLFVLVTSSAFAYDGSVYGDSIGKFLRKKFIETASDSDYVKELIETATDGADLERFYNVDNLDEEDYELLNDLETYIMDNYKVRNKYKFALW